MDLTREPLRLTTALTVVENEVENLARTPLRLVHEDELTTTPLRLLSEARSRGQPPQGQTQPPASGGNWVRRGLAGAAAGAALGGGIPGAVAGGAIGALSATNHPANFVSGWKGAKSGKGTLAHHIGQFLSPHQRALRSLQKKAEIEKASAGLQGASAEHQKAVRAHLKAQQQATAQKAKGTTTASPPPGGPAGGAAPSAPIPLPTVQHTPPTPPPAGGAPPAPPTPPTPPTGGTPPAPPPAAGGGGAPPSSPVTPPAAPAGAPPAGSPPDPSAAPEAAPPSSKGMETQMAKMQATHDELRTHIKNNKGAGRAGAHAILNKNFPGSYEPHEIDDIYSKLHRAEHGNEEPPEHEMKAPLGGAPAAPAAPAPEPPADVAPAAPAVEPKPAEPEKPEKPGGLEAAHAAVHQHIKSGGDISGTHKIMAQHGIKDPGLAKMVHNSQVKNVGKGLDHTGAKPKPPKPAAPPASATLAAPKPSAATPPKAPEAAKPPEAPKPAGPTATPPPPPPPPAAPKPEEPAKTPPKPKGSFGKGTKPGKPKPADAPAAEEPASTEPAASSAPTKAAAASGGEKGSQKGPGRPKKRDSTPVDKGKNCPAGETKESGPNVDGTSYCVKKQGGAEERPTGPAPVNADIYDLIGDLKALTDKFDLS